jgi:hypothetical protein
MNLLFDSLVAAGATTYVIELISIPLPELLPARAINAVKSVLILISSFFAMWLFDYTDFKLILGGLASSFISSLVVKWLSRPAEVVVRRRY